MLDRAESSETPAPAPPVERASSAQRTKVIIMAQVVAIVALVVVWSILRSKRAAAVTAGD